MQNLQNELIELLKQEDNLVVDGHLNKNKIVELALKVEPQLISLLIKNETFKKHFFQEVSNVLVFDKIKFQRFVNNKSFLPDSYTAFKNKIGLITNDDDLDNFISTSNEVVLAWPHKDCVLEGGQTKEDQKRNEIFWNETLAPDSVDRLLDAKALTNFKKFDKDGEHKVTALKGNENLILKGNNLLALASLLKTHRGLIKLIYIDPPYNTGNDGFQYNDNFNHSTWLTFMKNRLIIASQLLSEDGTICISIDNNELSYMQVLCDEIFCKDEGKSNKKNIITVKRSSVSGAKVINKGVVNVTEFLVIYSKNHLKWNPNRVFRKKERDNRYGSFITNIEENYENWKFSSVLEAFSAELKIEKSKLKKTLGSEYEEKLENFYYSNSNRIFRFVALDDNAVSDKVVKLKKISKEDPNKVYLLEREEKSNYYLYKGQAILFFEERLVNIDGHKVFAELLTDIWDDVLPNDLHNEGGVSLKKGKKPEKFIQRILELFSNESDVVLDYHLGSGTTASVAHKIKRKYIGVEQLDYEKNDSIVRLNNVINGEQSGISKAVNWQGGGSFVYAELKQYNKKYIDLIQDAETKEQLINVWDEMQDTAFLSYQFDKKTFNERLEAFKTAPIEEMKQYLIEVLDKNQLYVNYSEINDETFKVSQEDKDLNQQFYSKK